MNNSSSKPSAIQLNFFNTLAESVNPEIAVDRAEMPDFSQIRGTLINGRKYFSLIDILTYHGSKGSAKNPTVYWKRAKERLEAQGADVLTLVLEHRFEGQGQKNTPVVNEETFMRIAQAMDIAEWETIRAWMAHTAAERLEEKRNPEIAVDRAEKNFIESKMSRDKMSKADAYRSYALYLESKEKRVDFTDSFKDAVLEEIGWKHYAAMTNTEYLNLFGMSAKEINEATQQKTAKNGLTDEGRHFLMGAEMVITRIFRERGKMAYSEALEIVRGVCADYGLNVRNVEARLGISLATGRALLGDGQ